MANTTFINEAYLKENSTVNVNLETKKLMPAINSAQDIFINDLIGSGLSLELQNQISASTLTVLNTTLLVNYIRPALLWYTLVKLLMSSLAKISDGGLLEYEAENQKQISLEKFKLIYDEVNNNAQYYGQRLTNYLMANSNSYPLFDNPGSNIDVIHPRHSSYIAGMYFPTDIDCDKMDGLNSTQSLL
jgi:hypothetical protein